MRTMHGRLLATASLATAFSILPATLSGQLANASATALGTAGNTTATTRGIGAISANPAGLAMPGSRSSFSVLPMTVRQGLGPVTMGDLAAFEGTLVPAAAKEEWLARVTEQDREVGSVGLELSEIALTTGRFGFQLSTLVGATADLSPGVVEALLFGNAGRTGQPADLSLGGSALDVFAVTSAGLAMGFPLRLEGANAAVGATLKYSVGHLVVVGREQGGSITSSPLGVEADFPIISLPDEADQADNGSGVGLDLGFQFQRGDASVGVALLNAFNTFAWKTENLVYRPGTALFSEDESTTDFDGLPLDSASAELRHHLDGLGFDPTLSVGAAFELGPRTTVSMDVRNRFGDGMSLSPKLHAGAGMEYRGLGALAVRGGAALVTDGFEVAGGASLAMGPVHLSVAGAARKTDTQTVNSAQVVLSFGGH